MAKAKNQLMKKAAFIKRALPKQIDGQRARWPCQSFICEELQQIENEFKQPALTVDGTVVSVTTEPVTLGDVYLGPFKIQLDIKEIGSIAPADCFRVEAVDPHPAASAPAMVHPHVSGGRLCTGDATAPLSAALRDSRFCDFFIMIRSVLETYNPDSPYVRLEEWVGEPCYDCGRYVSGNESIRCPCCNRLFCLDCIKRFSCYGFKLCLGCLKETDHVKYAKCSNCPDAGVSINTLQEAISAQRVCAVELMIKDGADINSADSYHRTALHIAGRYGNREVVELLLKYGVDVNARDEDRMTALHWAALCNNMETVKYLVCRGAQVNTRDNFYLTPVDLAKQHKHTEVAAYLLRNGAEKANAFDTITDQRIRNCSGGSTRLPDYAHGRYITRSKPWQARMRYKGRRISLGVYFTKADADLAYSRALRRLDMNLPPVVR